MTVYPASEDSFLLAKEVAKYVSSLKNKDIKVLDMGSGSGIQALECMKNGIERKNILCADIDKETVAFLKKSGLNAVHSNLFSKIPAKIKYNLIIFNAPYLPADKYDKKPDTTAGKKGYEIIVRFLKQAKPHPAKDGVILLLFSSLSQPDIILKEAKKLGYSTKRLSEQNLFFEKIFVYRFY